MTLPDSETQIYYPEMTPTGYRIIPDLLTDFPLSRRGRTVKVDGKVVTIEPDQIIRGYRAHSQSKESEKVNSYQPEFYYARAIAIALTDIADLWKSVTPVDPKDLGVWSSQTIYNSSTFSILLDYVNSQGQKFRILSGYPDYTDPYFTHSREGNLNYLRQSGLHANYLNVLIPRGENPYPSYPSLLNVFDPTVTANSGAGEWYGHIITDTKNFTPNIFKARLQGVRVEDTEELVSYVKSIKDLIKS